MVLFAQQQNTVPSLCLLHHHGEAFPPVSRNVFSPVPSTPSKVVGHIPNHHPQHRMSPIQIIKDYFLLWNIIVTGQRCAYICLCCICLMR